MSYPSGPAFPPPAGPPVGYPPPGGPAVQFAPPELVRGGRLGGRHADPGHHPAEQAGARGGAPPARADHRAPAGGVPARRPHGSAARARLGDRRRPDLRPGRGRRTPDRLGGHRPDHLAARPRHHLRPRARGLGADGRHAVDELGHRRGDQARPGHRRDRHHRLPQPEDGGPVRRLHHASGQPAPAAGPVRAQRAVRPAAQDADRAVRARPRGRTDAAGQRGRAAVPDPAPPRAAGGGLGLPHPRRPRARPQRGAGLGAFDAPARRCATRCWPSRWWTGGRSSSPTSATC